MAVLTLLLGTTLRIEAGQPALPLPTADQLLERMAASEGDRARGLRQYSVLRHYTLTSKRSNKVSEMQVRMTYRQGQGKQFEVLETSGAEGMQRKALQRIVDGEADCSHKGEQLRFSRENYDLTVIGTEACQGRSCIVVETRPKRKSKYLLQGKAWIDATDFALVRIEGRPTESISFWVGKPYIVHEFQKVGGYWLATRNTSVSESRLLGTNELRIEYMDYQLKSTSSERLASSHYQMKGKTEVD